MDKEIETWKHGEVKTRRNGDMETSNGNPGIFLKQFTVCSLGKQKFVYCPFVDEETNGVIRLQTD
jgi:hypothetical protein